MASTKRCFLPPHPSAPSREATFALRTGARSQRDAPVDLVAAAFARLDATARRARDDARRNGPASSARPSRAEHVARLRVNPPDAMTMSSVVTPFTGIGAVRAVSRGGAASTRVRAGAPAASAGARAGVPASAWAANFDAGSVARFKPQASAMRGRFGDSARGRAVRRKAVAVRVPSIFNVPRARSDSRRDPRFPLARPLSLPPARLLSKPPDCNPRKAAAPHHGFSPPPPRNAHFPLVPFLPGDQLTRPPSPIHPSAPLQDPDRRMLGSEDDSDDFPRLSAAETGDASPRRKRLTRGERERNAESYEWTAWVSTCGVTSIAITATYLRLLREVTDTGAFPWAELFAQLALCAGAAVGMEFYARYAHKYLWHESLWTMPVKQRKEWNRPIWLLHESHHLPREGAFEANDIFAIANGVPAFALCAYGFLTPGLFGGLCFGAGLGITLFGIAYMYVHDGMVHKRFPTGPLGKLPFLRKIAAGHTIHHTEAFEGVPWGLFLSTQELAACPGGLEELERVLEAENRKQARIEEEAKMAAAGAAGAFSPWPREGEHIPSQVAAPACKLPEE